MTSLWKRLIEAMNIGKPERIIQTPRPIETPVLPERQPKREPIKIPVKEPAKKGNG